MLSTDILHFLKHKSYFEYDYYLKKKISEDIKISVWPTNTKNEANNDNNIFISYINDDINFEDIFFFWFSLIKI